MARSKFPFTDLARASLTYAESLVTQWLPGGKFARPEYKVTNPNRADTHVGSFSINVNTGAWSDFATTDAAGNDLISLYAYLNSCDQVQAGIEVADQIGYKIPEECIPKSKSKTPRTTPAVDPEKLKAKKPKEVSEWHPVLPVPLDAPEPPKAHIKRGLPESTWTYRDAAGLVLGYIYRFKTSDGGKETIPLTWCREEKTGNCEWHWMQMAEPRPLYGLDRLAAKPTAWVLLVSGEKCADAALDLLPNPAIVTWPGGDNGIDKVDWSPLAGRNIYAWADCDAQRAKLTKQQVADNIDPASLPLLPEHEQSGMKAMLRIAAKLAELDPTTKFKMVDIPAPGEKPSGWDIADGITEGMDNAELLKFIRQVRPHLHLVAPVVTEIKSKTAANPTKANAKEGDWEDSLILTPKGAVQDCRENIFSYLQNHFALKGLLAYDEFALRIVKRKSAPWDGDFDGDKDWSDNDNLELGLWLAQTQKLTIRSIDTINHAVKLTSSRNAYDPVIEYLDSLVWDKTPRLKYWLNEYVGIERNEYSELVGRLFLISMVARAYKPGCLMRAMPVFEGVQFRGKSSVARVLGGRWFSDSPLDLRSKDGFINIQGIWLNEIAELGSFNNQEAPIIKAYLSSNSDRFRSPFDTYARSHPRRTVFFGTTNEGIYLRDKTGNSRFWPLRTETHGDIDVEGLAECRDQLFAEAVALFKQGERWHPLADEQKRLFEPEQNLRQYDDPWFDDISEYLRKQTFTSTSVSEVLADCMKLTGKDKTDFNSQRCGKVMVALGWKKHRPRVGELRPNLYYRPEPVMLSPDNSDGGKDDLPF